MKNVLSILVLLACCITVVAQKIDRKAVICRNNPQVRTQDILSSLSVGNGHFVTTVDVTGLQSFPKNYEDGVPMCSMSDWGWHSFPNKQGLRPEETQKITNLGHGRDEVYAVEYKTGDRHQEATEYFRMNPHRLNLGNVGLMFLDEGRQLPVSEIKDIDQGLNLYDGIINSRYTVCGTPVNVVTASLLEQSALVFSVKTQLFRKGQAKIFLSLPYVTGRHADAASDWENVEAHESVVVNRTFNSALIRHSMDSTTYYVLVSWTGKAEFENVDAHNYHISPKGDKIDVRVEYAEDAGSLATDFNFRKDISSVKNFWNKWWDEGAIIDFSACTDPRARELERRVVLSQYLTYINCANDMPAQETGLTYNSWFGRPHLEMTWWHTVDFSLLNRHEVLGRILEWYDNVAAPRARRIAERQGFKGVRWMKMTDPQAGEAPSNVGSFLIWQQPHYIYLAEEMYRHKPEAEILSKYGWLVEETAAFMADYALSCAKDDTPIRLYGQTSMQESMSKNFSFNHPFEQAYWVYGLSTAQKWRERQGLPRNAEWDEIIGRMAHLQEHDGIYTAGDHVQPFTADTTSVQAFDPFNYVGDNVRRNISEADFLLKSRSDHPAVLGACGMLPDNGMYDREVMQRTLDWVMENWNWDTTWGWDYGMTAMCAARLGDGESAVRALLLDKGKNTYLVSGHNYQEPKRLRLYLPGNGALLTAVAMMCAGWEGCPDVHNPGFPQNGKWNVRWEGLQKMQ